MVENKKRSWVTFVACALVQVSSSQPAIPRITGEPAHDTYALRGIVSLLANDRGCLLSDHKDMQSRLSAEENPHAAPGEDEIAALSSLDVVDWSL